MIDLGEGFRNWGSGDSLSRAANSFLNTKPIKDDLTLGRIGSLEVRLADRKKDIKRAQRLRYQVFHEEKSAVPDMLSRLKRRDIDVFDSICDHLLVIDHALEKPKVVGTYRLLPQERAEANSGFYTSYEFDIAPMLERHRGLRFLELGRSCVAKPYRDKRTVELLWHGIWTYVRRNKIDVMFGCASFDGTDQDALAMPLSFLHHHARAEGEFVAKALSRRSINMNRIPPDAINPKLALQSLPPLIKGYLRLGAKVGEGAVIDHQFGTTDVLVILPVKSINPRYVDYYGVDATRYAP